MAVAEKKAHENVTASQMITGMFRIQNELNTKSYDKTWIEKGLTQEFDYEIAAGDEVHEFLRSLPYQWWTKDKEDRQNQVTEIVDAWHFVMSQHIIDHFGDVEKAANSAYSTAHHSLLNDSFQQLESTVKRQAKKFVAAIYLNNLNEEQHTLSYMRDFFLLMKRANISLELLYARYIGKATLNKFRVENGYKKGEYAKIWRLHGLEGEDNMFLSTYIDEQLAVKSHIPTAIEVRDYLHKTYEEVKAAMAPAS
jgi:hypothetical protein